MDIVYVLAGILLLTGGGETLIRGALAAARRLDVSPLLSGLLIVGFGTSAPELAVAVDAALAGKPDIALGSVVGSNISNVLLVLGSCAVIAPLAVQPLALRRDAVTVVGASLLLPVLTFGGAVGEADAAILLMALVAYLTWTYHSERYHAAPSGSMHAAEAEELTAVPESVPGILAAILLGLVMLIGGSRVLLIGAVGIAQFFGVSEAVIGLTLVAVGTSLPELAIVVLAAIRGHADVAVGNVLGSNIFNLFGVLGVSALLQPLTVHPRIAAIDQWIMLGTALVLWVFLLTGRRVSRPEGAILLAGYGVYIGLNFALVGS